MKGPVKIPDYCLVVMIGASGSGKSTFCRKHFKPTEVLSSDFYRGVVADDEADQAATKDAFDILQQVAQKRLAARRLTVIDATNVQAESRQPLVELARKFHALPVALVLKTPPKLCFERNRSRPDRAFGERVIRQQTSQLRRSLGRLGDEGFRKVFVFDSSEECEAAVIEREPLWTDRRHDHGPFDIIGDVHGCLTELKTLLSRLGYSLDGELTAPPGRKAVFVGDLVDRGPDTPGVLSLVMAMVDAGIAICVPGNHDVKLVKRLQGRDVKVSHGLAESLAQLDKTPEIRDKSLSFLADLVSHYWLDDGKLVVAHAGLKEAMQGRSSGRVREFCLYGETTGETDEFGLPVRHNWAAEYRGRTMVVYGHTPVLVPEWLNHTINIDTGCVFGGKLTALRYPERELVSVPAEKIHSEPIRPLQAPAAASVLTSQQAHDDVLDLEDVSGKRFIATRLHFNVTVREENAAAALEAMSRFAINPRWLIYLPPTMSPSETSKLAHCLEHPAEAFAYYRDHGVERLVCEEKHMGSRAVLIVCRDASAAARRFGITDGSDGVCYTRTGRRFFDHGDAETKLLTVVRQAAESTGLWEELKTDWLALDAELLPWSAKAQELLRSQYAAVGSSSRASLSAAVRLLEQTSQRLPDATSHLERMRLRSDAASSYVEAYRRYVWEVKSPGDLRLAPFHLLASEGAVHSDKDHVWHMETLARMCHAAATCRDSESPELLATPYQLVTLGDEVSEAAGIAWWDELTARGGEGMVVKPHSFVAQSARGLLQPAVKCRGREYLRIIYGPEYTLSENLERLRHRGVAGKRSLALREFALGLESLERFVAGEPLRRVHECVFGVLALESEPIDPRL